MILLDDEEIDKAYLAYMESNLPPMTDISRGANRAIRDAQLKKVVELIDKNSVELPYVTKTMDWLFWQTLKKEAGL